jgi:hypothetical protein
MRLWRTLHTLYRGKKGARRAGRPHTRLEVEALDQRLLPSSVPNLAGMTMHFNPFAPYTNPSTSLYFEYVQDLGGGKGNFWGFYKDVLDGCSTGVQGSMTLKGITWNPIVGGFVWDFGLTFSGSTDYVNYLLGLNLARASGSGDAYVTRISGNSSDYCNGLAGLSFAGTESDSFTVTSFTGQIISSLSESGYVWYTDYWNWWL